MIFLNQKMIASRLGVSVSLLEKFRRENTGPAWHRFGNKVMYSEDDLKSYLEECRVAPKRNQA